MKLKTTNEKVLGIYETPNVFTVKEAVAKAFIKCLEEFSLHFKTDFSLAVQLNQRIL